MKPVNKLLPSLILTLLMLTGLAYAASLLPTADTAETGAGEPGGVVVEVDNLRNARGNVVVLVFDAADAYARFDYTRAVAVDVLPAKQGSVRVAFPELDRGPYAVVLYHDEDGDYELAMDGENPIEGYGVSGSRDAYHEPSFDEAAIAPGLVTVSVFYLP